MILHLQLGHAKKKTSPITAETLSETFHSTGYFCVVSLVKDVIWLILLYYIICSKTFTLKVNLYDTVQKDHLFTTETLPFPGLNVDLI